MSYTVNGKTYPNVGDVLVSNKWKVYNWILNVLLKERRIKNRVANWMFDNTLPPQKKNSEGSGE